MKKFPRKFWKNKITKKISNSNLTGFVINFFNFWLFKSQNVFHLHFGFHRLYDFFFNHRCFFNFFLLFKIFPFSNILGPCLTFGSTLIFFGFLDFFGWWERGVATNFHFTVPIFCFAMPFLDFDWSSSNPRSVHGWLWFIESKKGTNAKKYKHCI